MKLDLPLNQYLGLGFGSSMIHTDMVLFQSSSTPTVSDLYSTGYQTPNTDSKNDYSYTFTKNATHVQYVAQRNLNTGESEDYVFKLVRIPI